MRLFSRFIYFLGLTLVVLFSSSLNAQNNANIPILCYHNLNPTRPGSMNLTPQKFESQLKWIKENGFTVIPLQTAVDYFQGKNVSLPQKPVVITADDGWQSVYTYMLPLIRKYNMPVTLFIYPETISHGSHAMTWDQLKELQQTGLFDIQGHTYSHPNFKHAKKELSSNNFEKLISVELVNSKKILEEKMGKKISFLAWPFGIYNPYLENSAEKAGYVMAFTIDARTANKNYRPMAEPRFMIVDGQSMKTFAGILNRANTQTK